MRIAQIEEFNSVRELNCENHCTRSLENTEHKITYEISPNGANASLSACVSISGLKSPTKM